MFVVIGLTIDLGTVHRNVDKRVIGKRFVLIMISIVAAISECPVFILWGNQKEVESRVRDVRGKTLRFYPFFAYFAKY